MLFFSSVILLTECGIAQQASNVYVEPNLAQVGDNLASQFCTEGQMMDINSNFFASGEVNDTGLLAPPIGMLKNMLDINMCVCYTIQCSIHIQMI